MFKKTCIVMLCFLVMLLFSGCAKKIKYSLDDIEKTDNVKLKNIVLDIQQFDDIRSSVDENSILFNGNQFTKINDKRVCINVESYYGDGVVPQQISEMISEHFIKRAAFKQVTVNTKNTADYCLFGKIKRFYSQQERSTAAEIGVGFGLIGALLTSGKKTNGHVHIEFVDLTLRDKNENVIKKLEDLSDKYSGEFDIDGYCFSVYLNINKRLKIVIDRLFSEVEKSLDEVTSLQYDQK